MTNVVKQGYLKKVNQNSRLSTILSVLEGARWFVFIVKDGIPYLEYYDNEESVFKRDPINSFCLQGCKSVQFTLGRINNDHSFCVVLEDRYLEFTAGSRDQMLAWANTIERSLTRLGVLKPTKNDHIYSDFPVTYKPRRSDEEDDSKNEETQIKDDQQTAVQGATSSEVLYSEAGDEHDDCNIFGEIGTYRRQSKPRVSITAVFDIANKSNENPHFNIANKSNQDSQPDTSVEEVSDDFWLRNKKSSEKKENSNVDLLSENLLPELDDLNDDGYQFLSNFSSEQFNSYDQNVKGSNTEDAPSSSKNRNCTEIIVSDKGRDIDEKFSQKASGDLVSPPSPNIDRNLEPYECIFSLSSSIEKKEPDSSTSQNLAPDLVPPPRISPNVKRKVDSVMSASAISYGASGDDSVYALENFQNIEKEKSSGSVRRPDNPLYQTPKSVQDSEPIRPCRATDNNKSVKVRDIMSKSDTFKRTFSDPVDPFEIPPPIPARRTQRPNTVGPGEFKEFEFRDLYARSKMEEEEEKPQIKRKNSSVLGQRQQLDTKSGTYSVVSLKQSQVDLLKQEIVSKVGIEKTIPASVSFTALALVDCFGSVWIVGWNKKRYPRFYDLFHIGDRLVSINSVQVHSAAAAYELWKRMGIEEKIIVTERLPHAEVFAVKRSAEGQSLGIRRHGGTAEIVYVDPNGLAAQHGLTAKSISIHGNGTCSWMLTEINSRPLNLFFKNSEIEHMLNAVGLDISFVVQPSDFIQELKKQLKKMKHYKEYLPC